MEKMERFSAKIEIINHFDNLINKVDIDIDSSLEKLNNNKQLLSKALKSSEKNRLNFRHTKTNFDFHVLFFDKIDSSKVEKLDSWPESTKVIDYLKQIRMRTIESLRKAQDETLEYYSLNSERFKSELTKEKSIDQLRSELFARKFYFQVNFKKSETRLLPLNLFTFVTDFYLSQSYIDSLEKLINEEKEPFDKDTVFDERIVLTGLLFNCFSKNLLLNFPTNVILVRKEDVSNIESIQFDHEQSGANLIGSSTIDLSKIKELAIDRINAKMFYRRDSVKFNIKGLSSLETLFLGANSSEVQFTMKNLTSLSRLGLSLTDTIYEDIVTGLLDQVPHIQELHLDGNLGYFNLDHLVNLRVLKIFETINEDFNLNLFKNLSDQLENIWIEVTNINEKILVKLFDGCDFPYLVDFTLMDGKKKRLNKELFNGFSTLKRLRITNCEIKVIERDLFSNLKQLCSLCLIENRIKIVEENAFSKLENLQEVDLSFNELKKLSRKFVGLKKTVEFDI